MKRKKKEILKEKIENTYSEEELINEFHIPREYVRGFIFYIIEDNNFVAALNENSTKTDLLLVELSVKYLEMIKE